jgi:hypothetical protein
MPHPGLTPYMKINTKYFDQGVTVIQYMDILFHRLWNHDMQNTRAHETTHTKIQRTKNCPEKY